jgi:hypothetical protein
MKFDGTATANETFQCVDLSFLVGRFIPHGTTRR